MVYYKAINKIVHEKDYRLINKFYFPVEEGRNAFVDHIIFGDKYFYVVISKYFDGSICGNLTDKSFILTPRKGNKQYIDNPYKLLAYVLERIATSCGIDKKLLIGIMLTNNSCDNEVIADYESYFVCKKKQLGKLISKIEHRRVGKLNDEQLQQAVLIMDNMNRKHNGNKR